MNWKKKSKTFKKKEKSLRKKKKRQRIADSINVGEIEAREIENLKKRLPKPE